MADDIFDCAQFVKERYPGDISEWPHDNRRWAFLARDRLLARHEGVSVVSERSYCIDSADERWPKDLHIPATHALIYEVKLSAPIEGRMTDLSLTELQETLAGLEALDYRKTYQQFFDFAPYPKQKDFLNSSAHLRERLLIAGNQNGKTHTGAFEIACHLTGLYPDWWKGRRFDRAVKVWVCGETSLVVRDVQQKKLCGEPGVEEAFGTGMIPKDLFADKPSLARGITDAYDTIQVRHVSGGVSVARFKSYEQGRTKFQGESIDIGWADEEPPEDVYAELLTRTVATGGMVFMTFTPLKGRSSVVIRFLDEPSPDRGHTAMTIDDALHISPEERARVIAGFLPHEREARARGVPMLGSGRIFMTAEEAICEDVPKPVPEEWAKLWGVDFGIDHPFAAVLIGWDKETDIIHILHAIRMSDALIMQQARAISTVGAAVPVAWPHDGHVRDRNSGEPLAKLYKNEGLLMLPEHAQWESGGISTEAGILEWDQREKNGKLKVARHLTEWLEERRFYHRKDGQIVKLKDDLMSATRIALMQKRSGKPVLLGSRKGNSGPPSAFAIGTPNHEAGDMDAFTGQ